MGVGTGFAIYFIIWWVTLFAILPFGVRSQHEDGAIEPGTDPGAPKEPALLKKAVVTTIVSGIVFAAFLGVRNSGLTLDDLPFPGYRH